MDAHDDTVLGDWTHDDENDSTLNWTPRILHVLPAWKRLSEPEVISSFSERVLAAHFNAIRNMTSWKSDSVRSCDTEVGIPLKVGKIRPLNNVDVNRIVSMISEGLKDQMTSRELHTYAVEEIASLVTEDTEYGEMAARLFVADMKKRTPDFAHYLEIARSHVHKKTKRPAPLLSKETYEFMKANLGAIEDALDQTSLMEFDYDYFALKTWEASYLQKVDGEIIETINYLFMRVSCGIHTGDILRALETYYSMSGQLFIHASPTLFKAGHIRNQMSSCFLFNIDDDFEHILHNIVRTGLCSRYAGGIGFSVSALRPKSSYIHGVDGSSAGVVSLLRVFDALCMYANQAGKRKGAFCVFLEPWHPEIFEFLDLKVKHGMEEFRVRQLNTALWMCDLFMERLLVDGDWSLFDIVTAPGLNETYGTEFKELYEKYERMGVAVKTVKAKELWDRILQRQTETAHPHIMWKDSINEKSNEKNLGIIHSGNLCTEIVEVTSSERVAVCVLAGLNIKKYIRTEWKRNGKWTRAPRSIPKDVIKAIDHDLIVEMTRVATRNLTLISMSQYYAIPQCKKSQEETRAIGIGLSGLAELFMELRIPFTSEEAQTINREIAESMYFAALTESVQMAREEEIGQYSGFKGSPASKGLLQFHLWGKTTDEVSSGRHDWNGLIEDIKEYGLANSQLIAYMPTATTGSLLGNTQSFQPLNDNVFVRRTMAGDFTLVNKCLVEDLKHLGLWCPALKDAIIFHDGSVQSIKCIPPYLKDIYKTVWEIRTSWQQQLAVERGWFTCQSQSLTVFEEVLSLDKLSSIHFGSWRKGLKTGMYYLRMRPKAAATKFTIDTEKIRNFCELLTSEVLTLRDTNLDESYRAGPVFAKTDVCTFKMLSMGEKEKLTEDKESTVEEEEEEEEGEITCDACGI